MRKDLSLAELGDLLDRPFNATLAAYRRDGAVIRPVPGRLRTWDFREDPALVGNGE